MKPIVFFRQSSIVLMIGLLLWSAASIGAFAQREDMRVSVDRPSYLLPILTIESAAPIGPVTLAVWNGSLPGKDRGDAIPALFFQTFSGATPKAPPLPMLDTIFRPGTYLRVVGIANRFVVFWTDNRADAPGTYLVEIDTNGRLSSEPRRVGGLPGHRAVEGGFLVVGKPELGVLVAWNEADTSRQYGEKSYGLRLDPSGAIPDRATLIAGTGVREIEHDVDSRSLALLIFDGFYAALVGSDGRVDPRRTIRMFTGSMLLRADTSVVVIEDGYEINTYASIFDSVPTNSAMMPEIYKGRRTNISTININRADDGRVMIRWVDNDFDGDLATWSVLAYQRELLPSGELSPIVLLDSLAMDASDICGCRQASIIARSPRIRPCENLSFPEIRVELRCAGVLLASSIPGILRSGSDSARFVPTNLPEEGDCLDPLVVPIRRLARDTFSSVSMTLAGRQVITGVPIAPSAIREQRNSPFFELVDGRLLAGWGSRRTTLKTDYDLVDFSDRSGPGVFLDRTGFVADSGGCVAAEHTKWLRADTSRMDTVFQNDGAGLVASRRIRNDHYRYRLDRTLRDWKRSQRSLFIATPGADGWNQMVLHHASADDREPDSACVESFARLRDSDRRFVAMTLGGCGSGRRTLLVIDSGGVVAARYDDVLPDRRDLRLVALDSSTVLLVGDALLARLTDGVVVESFPFAPAGFHARYLAIDRDRFLRLYRDSLYSGDWNLELYSAQGARLAARRIESRTSPGLYGISMAFRQSDGAIAVVTSSVGGVLYSLLMLPDLSVRRLNEQLSRSTATTMEVAAAFYRDTLVALWEGARMWQGSNPMSIDIYSNEVAIALQPARGPLDARAGKEVTGAIYPNPATGSVSIPLDLSSLSDVEISIYNGRGDLVLRRSAGTFEAGESHASIEIGGLAIGIYTIVVHSASASESHRLVVGGGR